MYTTTLGCKMADTSYSALYREKGLCIDKWLFFKTSKPTTNTQCENVIKTNHNLVCKYHPAMVSVS